MLLAEVPEVVNLLSFFSDLYFEKQHDPNQRMILERGVSILIRHMSFTEHNFVIALPSICHFTTNTGKAIAIALVAIYCGTKHIPTVCSSCLQKSIMA